jgi:Kef-type K+ transport system membrane component KefB
VALTSVIVIGKYVITVILGFFIPRPSRTFLVVAAGLSQIGEFSFILGKAGLTLGLLDLGFPSTKVQEYEDVVRTDSYNLGVTTTEQTLPLAPDHLVPGDDTMDVDKL